MDCKIEVFLDSIKEEDNQYMWCILKYNWNVSCSEKKWFVKDFGYADTIEQAWKDAIIWYNKMK